MDKQNMSYEEIFNLGVQIGINLMEDKIQRQCHLGKPILANDHLYWLKDDKQNLMDIMNNLDLI